MKKTSLAQVLVFAVLIPFASVGCDQMAEKGWKKTITLSSGDVILNMSGEWDVLYEGYGPFSGHGTKKDILTITQECTTFTAVKKIGSKWVPKGAETIKGELDKDGFKAVYGYIGSLAMDGSFKWESCEWEISENGNKVVLDCGERMKNTHTRS